MGGSSYDQDELEPTLEFIDLIKLIQRSLFKTHFVPTQV
jgi:hypothetical protein